ncbi:MAG TPA: TIGR03545 family protein [Pirellulaceae bacterium]|nr:TIGR03545 family protein [Pirellulaceae bacterium]HMO91811.1 TIGR03545 family protein [Pirellulaceae bacterium]HMP69874.1 TIGR03545 family protein [Pirellulaceae bacterium]
MKKWRRVLSRLGLLLFLLLLIWVGSRPLLKIGLIHSLQAMTGAKVEIDTVDFSLREGKIFLYQVEISNPKSPMSNLLQVRAASIQLDPKRLLHREFVIEDATLEQIQFGTPRARSGRLQMQTIRAQPEHKREIEVINQSFNGIPDVSANSSSKLLQISDDRFQAARTVHEVRSKWDRYFRQLREEAFAIQHAVRECEKSVSLISNNPLRDVHRYRDMIIEISELRKSIEERRGNVHSLKTQFEADQRLIDAAMKRDRQLIEANTRTSNSVDGRHLSELLLTDQSTDLVEEFVSWIHWFRDKLPDPEADFLPIKGRGHNVLFRQQPRIVFEKINLNGYGRLASTNFSFYGELYDASTNPNLHTRPLRIQLRGSAETEIVLDATLDRRGAIPQDTFNLQIPSIKVDSSTLGIAEYLQFNLAPCDLAVVMDLKCTGDQISGSLQMQKKNVAITLEQIHAQMGDQATRKVIDEQLAKLDEITVDIELNGSIAKPTMRLRSDLGQLFAQAINDSSERIRQQHARGLSDELDRVVTSEVASLDREFSLHINEVLAVLADEMPIISRLEEQIPKDTERWPKMR